MTTYGNLQNDRSQRKALEDLLAGTAPLPANALAPGSVPRSVAAKLGETISVKDLGAVGDGVTDDTAAIAQALNSGAANLLFPLGATFLMRSPAVRTVTTPLRIQASGAMVKLAGGAIVNTTGDYDQHIPLLDFRGGDWIEIIGGTFDQNRTGQTYPTGPSTVKPGTGANPFRDNAAIRVTAADSSTPARKVMVRGATFTGGYIAGIALIEVEDALIEACLFEDCTWNGLTYASCRKLISRGNRYVRCGTYGGVYEPQHFIRLSDNMPTGDRAGMQGRCRPTDWTEGGQGYPLLSTLYPNGQIVSVDDTFEECAVEGFYVRGVERCEIIRPRVVDVGLDVSADHVFNPTALWIENAKSWLVDAPDLVMTQARTLTPDGIRPTSMEGTGGDDESLADDPVPLEGSGRGLVRNADIRAEFGFPAASEAQLWRYGVYPNSKCAVRGGRISHCAGPAIYAINRGTFSDLRLNDLEVSDLYVEYCKRIGEITQYGGGLTPTGPVSFSFRNITFARMFDDGEDADDQCLFMTPSTFITDTVQVNATIDGLKGDCANEDSGSQDFRFGFIRSANTSLLEFANFDLSNYVTGLRVYNFATCRIHDWAVATGGAAIQYFANLGVTNSGDLTIQRVYAEAMSGEVIDLTAGTYTLDNLVVDDVRNYAGGATISGYDATYHLASRISRCSPSSDYGYRTVTVPFTDLRQDAAMYAVLPAAAGGTAGAAPGTPGNFGWAGTSAATLLGKATSSNAVSNTAGFFFNIPPDYVPGTNITAKVRCKMSVVRQTSATIDLTAQASSDSQALGSDICATAAQSCNTTTSTVFDFTLTGAGLTPGQRLFVVVTGAADDTGSGSSGTFQLHWLGMRIASSA